MPRRKILDVADKAARAAQRQQAGALRDNRVCEGTLRRYHRAVHLFVLWISMMGFQPAPDYEQLDNQLCLYLEALWQEGESKGLANDVLSGAQHFLLTRRRFLGAWHLLTTWGRMEVPCRAPPFPLLVVLALAGYAVAQRREEFAAILLAAFHCILRTGEMLSIAPQFIALDRSYRGALALPWTKIGQQRGAQEVVTVDEPLVGFWLCRVAVLRAAEAPLWSLSPSAFRSFFASALRALSLHDHGFMPYSLRRGGATFDFLCHQDMSRTLHRGRWSDVRTGKIYIVDGAAQVTALRIPVPVQQQLERFRDFLLQSMQ
jgi:hypothetical protein